MSSHNSDVSLNINDFDDVDGYLLKAHDQLSIVYDHLAGITAIKSVSSASGVGCLVCDIMDTLSQIRDGVEKLRENQ